MRENLAERAKRYSEVQERLDEIETEISELRQDTFSVESEDTEEKARDLFSEVSQTSGESSKAEQLDSLQEEREELEEQRAETEDELLELLVDVRLPLDETIQRDDSSVKFPYEESIDPVVLDAISDALGENLSNGDVMIGTDTITVETDSIDEAIDVVEHKITQIRQRADGLLNVPSRVEEVRERDEKVAAMLYVLYNHEEESLTKKEMEDKIGLERGDLRGQLYHVLDNDPYLKKPNGEVSLTATGDKVIERYVDKYDVPPLIAEGPDLSGPEGQQVDEEDQKEVAAYE